MVIKQTAVVDASYIGEIIGLRKSANQAADNYIELVPYLRLIAPTLLHYEIFNSILKHCRYHKEESQSYFADFNELTIKLIEPADFSEVYRLAEKYRLSFYDAAYIAILNQEKADLFLTFDGDFKKVEDERVKVIV
ncbi:MAG: type II toxin-antitoxin system VapC family toxin [Deltaproteobacteria bacterium]|nr:type II toxin-antitoxin system VapC family toxin [Deltaproteobacteria bacterium]